MKYFIYAFLAVLLVSGCTSTTKINASVKATESEAKRYNNLAILVLLPAMSNRATVEVAVDDKLKEMGISSMATFGAFPFAGNKEVLDGMNLKGEALRDKIKEKVREYEIDALMTISLLDAIQEERYHKGSSFTFSGPAVYSAYPEYGYSYYDYYHYAYSTVYSGDYYTTTTTYFLESNLYDIASERLIWTGQTETKDPSSIDKEARNFAELIVSELFKKQVIKK